MKSTNRIIKINCKTIIEKVLFFLKECISNTMDKILKNMMKTEITVHVTLSGAPGKISEQLKYHGG